VLERDGQLLRGRTLDELGARADNMIGTQKLDGVFPRDALGPHRPIDDRAHRDFARPARPGVRLAVEVEIRSGLSVKGANAGKRVTVAAKSDPSTSKQSFEGNIVLDAVDLVLLNTGHGSTDTARPCAEKSRWALRHGQSHSRRPRGLHFGTLQFVGAPDQPFHRMNARESLRGASAAVAYVRIVHAPARLPPFEPGGGALD